MKDNEKYILRCIEIAHNAEGKTYPNPMVGSVIVHNGKIIGEGYHRKAGTPHAEVHAINSVKDKDLLRQSTLYVCLEPCAHYGLTPPCAELIIRMGIPRVVVGCIDTFSKVSGKGVEMMRNAGIEVTVGVCEAECRELNKHFFTFHEKKRPYIILKWAQSADKLIGDPSADKPIWLTNDQCRRLVHQQRTHTQAIMVGVNTVISDNPKLNARSWHGNSPLRIIVDPHLRTPQKSNVLTDGAPTIILNNLREEKNGNITYTKVDFNSADSICSALYSLGIQSVIVEGGAKTLTHFISDNLWDEAYIYNSPIVLNKGIAAPTFNELPTSSETIEGITLNCYKRK